MKKIIYQLSKAEKNILKKVNISQLDFANGMLAEHKKDAAEQGLELFEYIEGMSDIDGVVYHLYAYDDAEGPTMIEDFDDTIDTTEQQYKHILKMFSVIKFYQDKREEEAPTIDAREAIERLNQAAAILNGLNPKIERLRQQLLSLRNELEQQNQHLAEELLNTARENGLL